MSRGIWKDSSFVDSFSRLESIDAVVCLDLKVRDCTVGGELRFADFSVLTASLQQAASRHHSQHWIQAQAAQDRVAHVASETAQPPSGVLAAEAIQRWVGSPRHSRTEMTPGFDV